MDLNELENNGWDDLIVTLNAFARSFAKRYSWFRSGKNTTLLMGKEIEDYVYEAIGRYLEAPEKFDPSRGDIIAFLKYNILRSLISNDANKDENKYTEDVYHRFDDDDDDDSNYLDRMLPYTLAAFPEQIDYQAINKYILNLINEDEVLENIYLGLYQSGMKRREIIKEFNMNEKDYNNGVRQLDTIIRSASKFFNPQKQQA